MPKNRRKKTPVLNAIFNISPLKKVPTKSDCHHVLCFISQKMAANSNENHLVTVCDDESGVCPRLDDILPWFVVNHLLARLKLSQAPALATQDCLS